jgi:hypothetical protein
MNIKYSLIDLVNRYFPKKKVIKKNPTEYRMNPIDSELKMDLLLFIGQVLYIRKVY